MEYGLLERSHGASVLLSSAATGVPWRNGGRPACWSVELTRELTVDQVSASCCMFLLEALTVNVSSIIPNQYQTAKQSTKHNTASRFPVGNTSINSTIGKTTSKQERVFHIHWTTTVSTASRAGRASILQCSSEPSSISA